MRWIKKFEELSPRVYINAGEKLDRIGQHKRGEDIKNYGINYESDDIYDLNLYDDGFKNTRAQFIKMETTLRLMRDGGFETLESFDELGNYANMKDVEIVIDFFFERLDSAKLVNPFSIIYKIWRDNVVSPKCHMCFSSNISNISPITSSSIFGTLLNRKNAIRFKKNVLGKIINDVELFPISDIISICGGDSSILSKCYDIFDKININYLYADNPRGRLARGYDFSLV